MAVVLLLGTAGAGVLALRQIKSQPDSEATTQAVATHASREAKATEPQAQPIHEPPPRPQPEPVDAPPAVELAPMPAEVSPEAIQVATADAARPEPEPAVKTAPPVETAKPMPPPDGDVFKAKVQPVLQQYCLRCHGADNPKGDFRVDTLHWPIASAEQAEEWRQALDRLGRGEMPPRGSKRPSDGELAGFIDAGSAELRAAAERLAGTVGQVVLRRLNRYEYENTLHDLFPIEARLRLRDMLPDDASVHGFDKIGSALNLSAEQIESYLAASERALRSALAAAPQPPPAQKHRQEYQRAGVGLARLVQVLVRNDRLVHFATVTGGEMRSAFRAPADGRYRIRIAASLYQTDQPLVLAVNSASIARTGEKWRLGTKEVTSKEPQVAEFEAWLPAGYSFLPLALGLPSGQAVRSGGGKEKYQGPGLAFHWSEIEGPLNETWPPPGHKALFGDLPIQRVVRPPVPGQRMRDTFEAVSANPAADADRLVRQFLPRAFRRPVTTDEVRVFVSLVLEQMKQQATFQEAMLTAYQAILCSPDFLFLREKPGRLGDHAIASRLSYFLWSTMPDAELLSLAGQGRLKDPQVRRQQVERMLASPKARQFTRNFCGQWLDLRKIDFTSPDNQLYPEFDELLADSLVPETELFFEEILRNDLSLLNFVHSDWAMLNQRLAEHYGVPGVKGLAFRKVTLPASSRRGGVLTQASVLKVTANGTVTSPVLRGRWILERLLNQPPAPPPPNVPGLEPDTRGATTIRQQYAAHRQIQSCAACHVKIDPHGFALENYDVIGGWREYYRSMGAGDRVNDLVGGARVVYRKGPAVAVGDVLPDGRRFSGIDQYKQILLQEKAQLTRALTEKLLIYSLGRGLTFADRPVVEEIAARTSAKNHGLRTLVHEIVASELFVTK